MEFEDWEIYYSQILRSFHFSREEDEASARILNQLLPRPRLTPIELEELIKNKSVYVFGAHESVDQGIEFIQEHGVDGIFLAAEGACSPLQSNGIKPDLIISDLDGNQEDLLTLNQLGGVPIVVHAHGDNADKIQSMAPALVHCMGTTQSQPFKDIHNFGGFTDGDRCVFLADHFGANRIILVGFDFYSIGKYSYSQDREMKLRKLLWAKKLISLFDVEYFSPKV